MDMPAAFVLPDDGTAVDLDAPPVSGEDYLRQVAYERKRVADIVVSNIDTKRFAKRQTVRVAPCGQGKGAGQRKPPIEWQRGQVAEFDGLRNRLRSVRDELEKAGELPDVEEVAFPPIENAAAWKSLCLRKKSTLFTPVMGVARKEILLETDGHALAGAKDGGEEAATSKAEEERGTPPYLRLVLVLPHAYVVELLSMHVEWLRADVVDVGSELPRERARWLFALMALVEKPLEPETCSALRDLARFCVEKRAMLTPDADEAIARVYGWFICVVARFFDQADLADE